MASDDCSPQLEDGYIRIATEIWEALTRHRIAGEQRQCLDFIIRKTYGWNKKMDQISITQFEKATGLKRASVHRALKTLKFKNIITISNSANSQVLKYSFNKRYKLWVAISKRANRTISNNANKTISNNAKHNKQIDTIKDKRVRERFALPSKEQINEAAKPKIKQDIKLVCDELYYKKIFPKAHAFANTMFKKQQNARAILHTLRRCYLKRSFNSDSAWAYCTEIIKVENGNFNEQDYIKNKA